MLLYAKNLAVSGAFQIACAGRSTTSIRAWSLSIKSLDVVRVKSDAKVIAQVHQDGIEHLKKPIYVSISRLIDGAEPII